MDILNREVFESNFAWINNEKGDTFAISDAIIKDLADEIAKGDALPSPSDTLDLYLELAKENFDHINFVKLCLEITSSLKDTVFEENSFKPYSVCYLRSGVADKAFECFSNYFEGLSAYYSTDFKTMCEDVYYERADGCIMPLESSNDGILASFRHLLIKYELKISGICKVPQNDDAALTLAFVTGDLIPDNGDIFEFYFHSIHGTDTYHILSMTLALGGDIIRINSAPSENSDRCDYHICVKLPEDSKAALIYSFDALYPSYIILGNYKNINIRKE